MREAKSLSAVISRQGATPFCGQSLGPMDERMSALARAMFSLLPGRPMWLVPTLVMSATVGLATAERRVSSPLWFMPISATSTWSSSEAESTVSGSPMRLLKLPAVACTPVARRERGGKHVLGRGLAHGPP